MNLLFRFSQVDVCLFGEKSTSINHIHLSSFHRTCQKPEVRRLSHQATNFRHVVQYLEKAAQTQLYPRYSKAGASRMVRLGYHRSLVGGIVSRPTLPQREHAMQILRDYASTPGQPYPLNVRLPFVPNLSCPIFGHHLPADIPFSQRQNLYQRVEKRIHTRKPIDSLGLDQ